MCKDPLKADACFEHVVESLRGPSLCAYVCVCVREASVVRRLMTSVVAAAPDRSRVLH